MRALDLFCGAGGAGGAAVGLHRAGFEVVGVDNRPQPRYPFEFHQGDALEASTDGFDLIWASPPCQAFTAYRRRPGHVGPSSNLIPATRAKVEEAGVSYIIENVGSAPLRSPAMLCGSSFGLDVRRHRFFETSSPVLSLPCNHAWQTPRFPPATNRKNLRNTVEVGVWRIPIETQQRAMGIGWMNREELSQAIPPAYSEFLARAFLKTRHRLNPEPGLSPPKGIQ